MKLTIEHAVAQAILAHPILQVGIRDEHTKEPYFVHLPTLDLSQIVRWVDIDPAADNDSILCRVLEDRHSNLWPDLAHRPGYEVILLAPKDSPSSGFTLDMVFSWHHALGDGTSGTIFHQTLLQALNDPSPVPSFSPTTHTLTLTPTPLLPSQESLFKFPLSWTFFLKTLWTEFAPSFLRPAVETPWTGAPITPDHNTTHIRLLTIPAATLTSLLREVKSHSVTLTPLIHILVLRSLSLRLPPSAFTSSTPISLRRLLPPTGAVNPRTAMGVYLAVQSHTFPSTTAQLLRSDPTNHNQLWSLTTQLSTSLKQKVSSLPADDLVGLLPYITDPHKRWLGKVGQARETTWEVSNVGAVEMEAEGGWRVDRMVFSQSGNVAGNAFGVNVAAVRGGELAVTLSWQEGIVQGEVMDGVRGDLEGWLTGLAEGRGLV